MIEHDAILSFGKYAKKEILSLNPQSDCCYIAFLSGLINTSANVLWENGEFIVVFEHESDSFFSKLSKVISHLYNAETIRQGKEIILKGDYIKTMLFECGYFTNDSGGNLVRVQGIQRQLCSLPCCKVNYLRGAFVGGGSVSILRGYHLEFSVHTQEFADDLSQLLASYDLHSKITVRKDKKVVYIKDREQISDLLALLGASKSVIKLNDEMVYRAVRQNSNRASNCDLANLDKTLNASLVQVQAINIIDERIGIDSLDETLQEIALIRLAYEDYSLAKIAQMLGISKSTVKNRMNKIIKIGEKLKNE